LALSVKTASEYGVCFLLGIDGSAHAVINFERLKRIAWHETFFTLRWNSLTV